MDEANREYKDSVLRDMLNDKVRTSELTFALKGIHIPPEKIVINTFEGIIMGKLRNDLSFLAGDLYIFITEHQSTINPNMPLRMFLYAAGLYKPFTTGDDIYTSRKIMIPAPELYVLYNGVEKRPARWTMRLSDSFMVKSDALEVKVQAININHSPRHKILQKSPTLLAYSVFVDQARKGKARGLSDEEALKNAVEYCIKHGYMAEYFRKKQEEVVRVMKIQWNMDDALRVRGEEGYEDGHEEGTKTTLLQNIRSLMNTLHLSSEEAMNALMISPDRRKIIAPLI